MEHQPELRHVQCYTVVFKRKVIEEYLAGGISQMGLLRKYRIGGKSSIPKWMQQLGYITKPVTSAKFTIQIPPDLAKKTDLKSVSELHKRIKELERQLEDEKLRSEAYGRIIDKAEKELKIPIRKKPNTR